MSAKIIKRATRQIGNAVSSASLCAPAFGFSLLEALVEDDVGSAIPVVTVTVSGGFVGTNNSNSSLVLEPQVTVAVSVENVLISSSQV